MKWNWLPAQDATTRDILKVVRPGIMDSTVYALDQACVLYIFRGSLGLSGRIQIQGHSSDLFQPAHLYARTTKTLWKIDAIAWLKPALFEQSHDSAFVNMRQLPRLIKDPLEKCWYQFTFPDHHVEQVPISYRWYARARKAYRNLSVDLTSIPSRGRTGTRPGTAPGSHPDSTEAPSVPSAFHPAAPVQCAAGQKPYGYSPIPPRSSLNLDETDPSGHDARHQKARAPVQTKAGGS